MRILGAVTSLTRLEEYFKLAEVDDQIEPSPSPTDSNILMEVVSVWRGFVDHCPSKYQKYEDKNRRMLILFGTALIIHMSSIST